MGMWEIAVIVIVALIVIGPKQLPTVARTLGKWAGKLKRLRSQFDQTIDEQLKFEQLEENKRKAKEAEE